MNLKRNMFLYDSNYASTNAEVTADRSMSVLANENAPSQRILNLFRNIHMYGIPFGNAFRGRNKLTALNRCKINRNEPGKTKVRQFVTDSIEKLCEGGSWLSGPKMCTGS